MKALRVGSSADSRLFEALFLILYKYALDMTYSLFQGNLFGYYGFSCDYSFVRQIVGWCIYLILVLLFSSKKCRLSDSFIYVVFLLSISPCIVYYQYNIDCKIWMIIVQIFTLVFMKVIFMMPDFVGTCTFLSKIPYTNKSFRKLITVVLVSYLVYQMLKHGMPSLSAISFSNISEIRVANSESTLMSIVENLICKIISPLYMLVALKEKKYVGFLLALIIDVYTYSFTGFKTILFIPILMIGISFFSKLNLKKCVLYGVPSAFMGSAFLYKLTNNIMFYGLINERVFFLPAKIKIAFFDYFSKNEFVYFSQNTIAHIFRISSNYDERIPYLIGREYFNRPQMWTNTGFMADAYSNLGIVGMLMMALIIVFIIKVAEKQMKNLDDRMKRSLEVLFLIYFISLNDGGTISILFSGGMLFIVIMMEIVDFSEPEKVEKRVKNYGST